MAGQRDRERDVTLLSRRPHSIPPATHWARAGKCLTKESRNHRRRDGRLGEQRTAREHVDDLLQFLRESDSSDKTAGHRDIKIPGESCRRIPVEMVGAWPLLYNSRGPSCMVFFQLGLNDLETVAKS
jgi:hypothetical protein